MPKPKHTTKRVTLAHIAEVCDVSRVTVSKALRDDPKISEATRARVREAAQKLGYVRDSRLSELMTYLGNERRLSGVHEEIPYLYSGEYDITAGVAQPHFYAAARKVAEEQGFRLEPYHLTAKNRAALERSFAARSVRGILLAPFSDDSVLHDLHWERYALMGFGLSHQQLQVARVDWNYRLAVRRCIRRMRELGYRRVGVISSHGYSKGLNYAIEAEAWTDYHQQPEDKRVEPLLSDRIRLDHTALPVVGEWVEAQKPDAILCTEPNYDRIIRLGIVDESVGFASWWKSGEAPDADVAGMAGNIELLAELGTKTLVGMIYSGQRGFTDDRTLTLLDMVWHDGATAPGYGKPRG